MEKYFTYEWAGYSSNGSITYHNVVLNSNMNNLKEGAIFDKAILNMEDFSIEFIKDNHSEIYPIEISISEQGFELRKKRYE